MSNEKGSGERILEVGIKVGTLVVFGSVAVGSLRMAVFFFGGADWMHVFEKDIFTPVEIKFIVALAMTGFSLGFTGLGAALGIVGLNAALNGWD